MSKGESTINARSRVLTKGSGKFGIISFDFSRTMEAPVQ